MFTTVDIDGSLHSRPMATQEVEFDGDLWFFTRKSSGKIHSIFAEQQVNIAYSSPKSSTYVSVSGRAELVEDDKKIHDLWNPLYAAWFPKGLEDPDLILLKIKVESAEYWTSHSSAVVQLFGFAKAALTGQAYKGEASDHAKINLRH